MVLQYKEKSQKNSRWKKYHGKNTLQPPLSKYEFRLLTEDKSKILAQGNYQIVIKRFRQVEFFKHKQ